MLTRKSISLADAKAIVETGIAEGVCVVVVRKDGTLDMLSYSNRAASTWLGGLSYAMHRIASGIDEQD